jgi:hypothetical protein
MLFAGGNQRLIRRGSARAMWLPKSILRIGSSHETAKMDTIQRQSAGVG